MSIWHLIGSGDGKVVCRAGEKIVRFNRSADSDERWDLNVCNGKLAGESQPFSVDGVEPVHGFATLLKNNAEKLKEELGTRPSSGLATLFTLYNAGLTVRLSCMNLLPSIVRPMNLGARVPLPCTFHNWLGERRVALPIVNALRWPGFWLSEDQRYEAGSINPYSLLTALSELERSEGRKLIAELEHVATHQWKEHGTQEAIREMEPLFFLSRSETTTPKWWLYDRAASQGMSQILHRLARAQQALWLRA